MINNDQNLQLLDVTYFSTKLIFGISKDLGVVKDSL